MEWSRTVTCRGKIERFYGTVTTELIPLLPGHIPHRTGGRPTSPPTLTLGQLEAVFERFVVEQYHRRPHSKTGRPEIRCVRGRLDPVARLTPTTWTCCRSPPPPAGSCSGLAWTVAIATIARITGDNFRLVDRLLIQMQRIRQINALDTITPEVVEAVREAMLIGN